MKWTNRLLWRAVARVAGKDMPLGTKERWGAVCDAAGLQTHVGVYLGGECVDTWETSLPWHEHAPVKIALLNTSIITGDGSYEYRTISQPDALRLLDDHDGTVSHIGHDSTAAIMTELLGVDVPMSRVPYTQRAGDIALVFKLNGRPPEGRILSREEIESIGYTWGLLTRTA